MSEHIQVGYAQYPGGTCSMSGRDMLHVQARHAQYPGGTFCMSGRDMPHTSRAHGGAGLPPGRTLLGLYEGVPQTRRTRGYTLTLPDKITLFRNPILAVCRTPREVQERVRAVVIHELAHHFGIDDQRLRDLDAY